MRKIAKVFKLISRSQWGLRAHFIAVQMLSELAEEGEKQEEQEEVEEGGISLGQWLIQMADPMAGVTIIPGVTFLG